MEKEKQQPDPRPIPTKPEVTNPAEKEQREITKEQTELGNEPSKENVEKPEIPKIPEELP